jgi:anti-sigma factor (TIGR02949 family)
MWCGSVDLYETDCEEVLAELESFVDAELDPARARVIEAHLAGCGPCADRGDFRRRLRDIIRRKCGGMVDLPPGVADRVRRTLSL